MQEHLQRIRALAPEAREQLGRQLRALLAPPDEAARPRTLAAFYVARDGLSPRELRAFLQERLPDHVVPSEFVALEALPRTVNGKVDRRGLRELRAARPAEDVAAPSAPANEREERLARIWSRILNVPQVAREANFFELGGHSLLATQVVMEIEQQFGLEIPLGALFKHPTVAGLCRHLEGLAPAARPLSADDEAASDDIPLSFAQRRLWYASQVGGEGLEYKIVKVLELRGPLNVAAVRQGVSEIVNRHETLRTLFGYRGGRLVQRVQAPAPAFVELVDLRGLDADAAERVYQQTADDVLRRPFDLEQGPLLRLTLVRLAPRHARLLFDVHHIVVDGWSFGVLVQELNRVFLAFTRGLPAGLPPLPVQYRQVALAERRRLGQDEIDRQLAYWKTRLAGAPRLEFADERRGQPPADDGEVFFAFEVETPARLAQACARLQVTPFMFLVGVYHVLLHARSGALDICVGTDVSNRDSKDHKDLIGFFANQVVLRLRAAREWSFSRLCREVRAAVEEAFANKALPYDVLAREMRGAGAEKRREPLFRAMFSYHHQLPDLALDGLETRFLDVKPPQSKYDLLLNVEEGGRGLRGSVEYSGAVFDGDTARELGEDFTELCARACLDVEASLADLCAPLEAAARARRERARAGRQHGLRRFLAARAGEEPA